jgi:hypothetical protein
MPLNHYSRPLLLYEFLIMALIPVPYRISFEDWTAQLIRSLPNLLVPTIKSNETNWRSWAKVFIQINSLDLPFPADNLYKGEEGWRQWACLCLPTLESL